MNGLDDLTAQREAAKRPQRAKRTMPPARHPRSAATSPPSEGSEPTPVATASARDSRRGDAALGAELTAPAGSGGARDTPDQVAPAPQVQRGHATRKAAAQTREAKGPVAPLVESQAVQGVVAVGTKVKPVTVSLDEADIDWLDGLRILGMQSKPKVDIGRSALVRLALARLRDQVTDDEIWAHLSQKAAQAQGAGVSGRRRL